MTRRNCLARFALSCACVVAVLKHAGGLPAAPDADPIGPGTDRLRIIVETDAGGDPDDEQSMVRFLLYVNEWDVEGIIATRPVARDGENLNTERTGLGILRRMLNAYEECYPYLRQHDEKFPPPDFLREKTVAGYDGDAGVSLI
ncbi:MAG: DUF1593 domain-containing protein, partial [Planctomycetia bacterium]|nr:DUF1593 domain-containing protein [Planctomycetia bacterium]